MVKKSVNPYLTSASPDDLAPTQRLAYDIIAARPDLIPSVERIMNAGLDALTLDALSLFDRSLRNPGDPNRDPAVAIAQARAAVSTG